MIYDLHRHLWPQSLVDALRARAEVPFLRNGTLVLEDGEHWLDPDAYCVERCLADLDRHGIDVAVVSCPPTLGIASDDLRAVYHDGMREAAAESGGGLLAFSMDRPEPGFAGTCVAAGALLDLDRLAPVLDEVERNGALLFVHPGPSPPPPGAPEWWPAVVGYTMQMQAAYMAWLGAGVDRWPELRVLFAILAGGAPVQLERLRSRGFDVRRALRSNLHLDTASYGRRALELCLATYGSGALVFGSDAPVIDSAPTLEAVRGFGQAVAETICGSNPRGLLE
jgi:6-methylsalicylate decarboxylase